MITIALSDPNTIYCQSLKTLLEQIDDFRVILVPPADLEKVILKNISCDILLLDNDVSQSCQGIRSPRGVFLSPATLLLATYLDELENRPQHLPAILKNAGKREFEKRIRACIVNRS